MPVHFNGCNFKLDKTLLLSDDTALTDCIIEIKTTPFVICDGKNIEIRNCYIISDQEEPKIPNYKLDKFLRLLQPQVRGLIGVRSWRTKEGKLWSSGLGDVEWTNPMVADEVPTAKNDKGLYAYNPQATPLELLSESLSGLVELRGKIVEHDDGVLRASWARILCIFCGVEATYEAFTKLYPDIHVYYGQLVRRSGEAAIILV